MEKWRVEKMNKAKEYTTVWARKTEDRVLAKFWEKLCENGVARMTFYENMPKNSAEFCSWAKANAQDVRLILAEKSEPEKNKAEKNKAEKRKSKTNKGENNEAGKGSEIGLGEISCGETREEDNVLAMYWLNNPLGKALMIHFCYTREAFSEQYAIGEYVVRSLLFTKDEQGEFVISALMGLTPKVYRHALRFIEELGFSLLGILPKSCFFSHKRMYKDGVISVLTRADIMRKST